MVNLPPLIGLVGAAGAGKDTVAQILEDEFNCWHYSSADPIKEVFIAHFSYGKSDKWKQWACYDHEGKASLHPYIVNDKGDPITNREVLELIGDRLNSLDPLVLVRPMLDIHQKKELTVVDSSTREDDQANFVKNNGGTIIYVQNSAREKEIPTNPHHTAVFWKKFRDGWVINNDGSLDDLRKNVKRVVGLIAAYTDPS